MLQRKQKQQQNYLPITRSTTPPATSTRTAVSGAPVGRFASPDVTYRRAPNHPMGLGARRDRFVSLPEQLVDGVPPPSVGVPTIFEDLQPDGSGVRGRITVWCLAEAFDRKALEKQLRERRSKFLLEQYPDVLYGQYWRPGMSQPAGDIFYFDYGCVAFWGLAEEEEQDVLSGIVRPCLLQPLPADEVEVDEFEFVYSMTEKPHIQNDTITINYKLATEHLTKLSICFALSQSTKLLVYEERVMAIVQSTRVLPAQLASNGEVHLSRKKVAQLIGRVFIQKSAVNLMSTVLDTPDFFWSAYDSFQHIYKKVCEYLEYDTRIEVLNNRFQVLQELLDMLRDMQNAHHAGRLEWIVIWLIVVEVIVGLLEVAGLFGVIGRE